MDATENHPCYEVLSESVSEYDDDDDDDGGGGGSVGVDAGDC